MGEGVSFHTTYYRSDTPSHKPTHLELQIQRDRDDGAARSARRQHRRSRSTSRKPSWRQREVAGRGPAAEHQPILCARRSAADAVLDDLEDEGKGRRHGRRQSGSGCTVRSRVRGLGREAAAGARSSERYDQALT